MSEELHLLQEALGPRYQLGAVLGRGGMATVYRAVDTKHGREVAVKVLDQTLGTAIGLERFQREIAIASSLQHPNIVPLYDSGGADSLLFYIMPLVAGESLRQRLKRETQLPVADALSIVRDVAAALHHAHFLGVVHRDIKPENILLSGGKAMVADFGIARVFGSMGSTNLTDLGLAVGTPAYMSPEQADGTQPVDGRADTYALGCVLFEMLAGEPPFSGRTAQALLARHLHERPPSVQLVRPTVTDQMQEALERALAKVPADRFTTAVAFSDALDAAQLAALSGATRRVRSRRRSRVFAGAAATVLLAAGATIVYFGRDPTADPNRLVVYPISVPASDEGIGDQVALMIESALEHTEPLRWLDGQALLGPDRRIDARLLGPVAARLARRSGARYYLDGALVRNGDSLTVIVRLHDAAGDSLIRQESATGATAATTAPQLALRSVALILPWLLPPNGRVDLSYLVERDPAAIADWLQGEREYARSQYGAALRHMNRALERDTAMAVAALKGAQAAVYLQDYPRARDLVAVSLKNERQLPRRHLALARGLRSYLTGEADSAVAAFRAARAADSSWSEPLMMLAETYYHLLPVGRSLDSLAEQSMRAALRLQPGFAPALNHLMEFAVRRGDPREARALLRQFAAVRPDSDWVFQADLMVRCAFDGLGAIDWPAAVMRASDRVVDVARIVGGGQVYPACARRALESVIALDPDTSSRHALFRWSALKGLDYQALAEGRPERARTLVDSATAHGVRAAPSLNVLNAAAGAKELAAAADTAMRTVANRPVSTMATNRLRYMSLWAWHRGDVARLDSVVQRLRDVSDSTGRGTDRLARDGAIARLAALRGDTATAIRTLLALRAAADPAFVTWDLWESAASERLLLAQLQLATGDATAALETAQLFDSPRSQVYLLYQRASLAVRGAAAERLGRRAEADRYRARLRAGS